MYPALARELGIGSVPRYGRFRYRELSCLVWVSITVLGDANAAVACRGGSIITVLSFNLN